MSDPAPPAGANAAFDEMVTGGGRIRPHWYRLVSRLAPIDAAGMAEREEAMLSLLREHGVTYTIHGDPNAVERPWPLDPIPFVLAAEDWAAIEAGVVQRARLLDAVLQDLYGPQRLIADGIVPAALLYANPAYLRPLRDLVPAGGTRGESA